MSWTDVATVVGILVAWLVLTRVVLPRFGVAA